MDNPQLCKTTSSYNVAVIEGLRNVRALPEQIVSWCMSSLEKANENLRALVTNKPTKPPCKDTATLTEPVHLQPCKAGPTRSKAERKIIHVTINKKSMADCKTKPFSLPTYANFLKNTKSKTPTNSKNEDEMFTQYLDQLRRILYVDDDHMLHQEKSEETCLKSFYQRIDKWEQLGTKNTKVPQPKSKCHAQPKLFNNIDHSSSTCWNRLIAGGDRKRCCCGGTCQRNRTFVEYDWTNYDWCDALREELRRRTIQLNRLKRELKLRAIRVLPNVSYL